MGKKTIKGWKMYLAILSNCRAMTVSPVQRSVWVRFARTMVWKVSVKRIVSKTLGWQHLNITFVIVCVSICTHGSQAWSYSAIISRGTNPEMIRFITTGLHPWFSIWFEKIRLTRVTFSISILNLVALCERNLSYSSLLLLSRFCDLVFQGPLSVQEDWIKHLQRHIMNTSVPYTGLGMVEVTSQPTTLKTDQDSSLTATNAASWSQLGPF